MQSDKTPEANMSLLFYTADFAGIGSVPRIWKHIRFLGDEFRFVE